MSVPAAATVLDRPHIAPPPSKARRWRRRYGLAAFGAFIVVAWIVVAALAPLIALYPPAAVDVTARLRPPSAVHWLGTNSLGRDVFTRLIYGARISLFTGITVVLVSAVLGTLVGAVAAYARGRAEELVMRVTDLVLCFPPIILAMAIAAALGIGTLNTIIAMLVVWWPKFARLARSLVLVQRSQEYVEAAVVMGLSPRRIVLRHIVPNAVGPLIVLVTLDVGNAIITFAGLSFLGLGVVPPTPEWGSMVSEGRELIEQWWVATFPGLAILSIVLGFNFLGDGIRDWLDPQIAQALAVPMDEPLRPDRPIPASGTPVLDVKNLQTQFFTDAGVLRAVDGVSFTVAAGETLGIVGESGSGKSVTASSLIRLLDEQARIVGGEVRFQGRDVLAMTPDQLRSLRGNDVAMVFQDPMTSLNPVLRIAAQMVETMMAHGRFDQAQATERAVSLLGRMGITAPERAINSYPHQFSGGMRQRVMLAIGFSNEPALLIADEPTTALDVTIQAQILDLISELNRDFGAAIILISHALGVIASVCQRVLVMYAGEIVEEGPTEAVLADPRHPYTWALINAVPRVDRDMPDSKRLTTIEGAPPDPMAMTAGCRFQERCPFSIAKCSEHPPLEQIGAGRKTRCWVTQSGEPLPATMAARSAETTAPTARREQPQVEAALQAPLLSVRGLVKHFALPREDFFGKRKVVRAIDGVDLDIAPGETVGMVGESGCGKSTFARLVVRIHEPTAGSVMFAGTDLAKASAAAIRPLRRRMQMVFQDPYASLNPRMTVGEILSEPLEFHGLTATAADTRARVEELLSAVGLNPRMIARYPHEFSGGQRQRISIARALALEPEFIIADEPISSLDVNIQAQIINLLIDLQERFKLTYLFIAHDLAVVRHICDRIVVLYLGKVAEIAPAHELFAAPLHPYTRYLISAVPIPDAAAERRRKRLPLVGEPPSAIDPPSGCCFRTRCPIAKPICAEAPPPLVSPGPGTPTSHVVACHFPGQF